MCDCFSNIIITSLHMFVKFFFFLEQIGLCTDLISRPIRYWLFFSFKSWYYPFMYKEYEDKEQILQIKHLFGL